MAGKLIIDLIGVPRAFYFQSADPAVANLDHLRTGINWIDTTSSPYVWKRRNAANDGWDTLGKIRTDTEFAEDVEDKIGAKVIAGTGISVAYNDATGETTITNSDPGTGGTPSTEAVQDIVGAMLTDSSTIDFTYDDGTATETASVIDDAITNAKLANMAQATIKGRAAGAGTGDPTDLSAAQVRSILLEMQRWTINFTANGDAYIPADVAMTIDAGVTAIGTGTLAYEKSTAAAPSTFSSTTLPATLEAGAWLKVTVSSITGFKVVELKRTA